MAKNLVIVESPAKAKTLKKFLGSAYKIEASVGHVRDLPKSELGINIENDFEPKYITIRGKGEVLAKLRKEAKAADKVYLATDPDREGEAISWHLMHALKLEEKNTARITFNEITKNAVKKSIKEARKIDMDLVDAQQARRELDRIVGYMLSPFLWRKVRKGLSAGRVQSVALKMICDREDEIENFTPAEYWTLNVTLDADGEPFTAKFHGDANGRITLGGREETERIEAFIKTAPFVVSDVKQGTRVRKPVQPFTTSTLQQEASKLLGFATHKTMMIAQQLYEGVDIKGEGTTGLVSYIRTDSMRISDEAYAEVRQFILNNFGEDYANKAKTEHKAKGRSQDAHEAIRPTSVMRTPLDIKDSLTKDQHRLYKLIWDRFVASQMEPAVYDTLSVRVAAGDTYFFRSSGSRLKFKGFLAVYNYSNNKEDEQGGDMKMPAMTAGQAISLVDCDPQQHFTQPPPRYTEAMLVRTMESLGIGRPSTYSATISNILFRGYVTKENKMFYPTELGEIVNDIMKNNFEDIVDIDFTAKMEENLDRVEEGDLPWKDVVRQFYPPFDEKIKIAEEKIGHVDIQDQETDVVCENCGRNMVIKFGRYGKFLACPGFPECRNAKPLYEEAGVACPLCGDKVMIKKTKKGRKYFGCAANPECSFMSWNRPTGEKCPKCGGVLVEKGTKQKKICCADSACGYLTVKDDERE